MRLANLNIFLPCLVLSYYVLSVPAGFVVMLIALPFSFLNKEISLLLTLFGTPILVVFSLIIILIKYDLSPKSRKPEHERRYRIGHIIIFVMNIILLLAVILPPTSAKIFDRPEYGEYLWLLIPIYMVSFFAWAIGLFMVASSRS